MKRGFSISKLAECGINAKSERTLVHDLASPLFISLASTALRPPKGGMTLLRGVALFLRFPTWPYETVEPWAGEGALVRFLGWARGLANFVWDFRDVRRIVIFLNSLQGLRNLPQ